MTDTTDMTEWAKEIAHEIAYESQDDYLYEHEVYAAPLGPLVPTELIAWAGEWMRGHITVAIVGDSDGESQWYEFVAIPRVNGELEFDSPFCAKAAP